MLLSISPPSWLLAWIALVASLVSLGISLITFITTQRRPRIQLLLPSRLRVTATGDGARAFIYLQPIFTNVGRSTRAELITPNLVVEDGRGEAVAFEYIEKCRTVWDADRREVHVEYLDDASPIILPQNSIKSEMLTFRAPIDWRFARNWYRCSLVGNLAASTQSLTANFELVITEDHLRIWLESDGRRYVMLPVMQSSSTNRRANSR